MKLVEIHWVDSMGVAAAGWYDRGCLNDTDMTMQTFGWLVEETEHGYVVSAHRTIENDNIHSPLKIPKEAVTGIWIIELP